MKSAKVRFVASLVVICASIFASQSSAAPILMLQLHLDVPPQPRSAIVPSTLDYNFSIYKDNGGNNPSTGLIWSMPVTAADVGHTFDASPSQLADVNSITNGITIFVGGQIEAIGGGIFEQLPQAALDSPIHDGNGTTLTVTLNVPSLKGYQITSMTRSVDSFFLQSLPPGSADIYQYGGSQTLSVFGVQVPEPSTLVLVSLGGIALVARRGRT